VKGVLSARLDEANLRAEVTGPAQGPRSIHAKMQRDGVSLDEIYDVIAFRDHRRGRHRRRLLRARHRARDLAPGGGSFQGLRRAAEGQRLQSLHYDR
jgi:hypothetical protein